SLEVKGNTPWLLNIAELVRQRVPNARFLMACFKERQAETVRAAAEQHKAPVEIHVGKTPEIIRAATCAVSVSGSVSLELMRHKVPSVIIYRISHWAWMLQKILRRIRFMTLVNLLDTDELFPKEIPLYHPDRPEDANVPYPEYAWIRDPSDYISNQVVELLTDSELRQRKIAQLEDLNARYAQPGASRNAAAYILDSLGAINAPVARAA
ncbi:MAG: hypothetical protein N2C14_17950, partial [Planctomycetales bacterium]